MNEVFPDLSRGTYQDIDTSEEKGKGRAVKEGSDLDQDPIENGHHLQESPIANSSQYFNHDTFNSTAPEHQSFSQPDYASLGYVHAGGDQSHSYGGNPVPSALPPNQPSSSAPASTAAGQISSRSKRRARKPAGQPSGPPKEKKPVKPSKKKSLAEVRATPSGLLWRPSPDQQWSKLIFRIPHLYH